MFDKLKDCTIVILGLGKEGLSSYQFFRNNFPNKKLFLLDEKPLNKLSEEWHNIHAKDKGIKFANNFNDLIENLENDLSLATNPEQKEQILVVKSPGIPPTNQLLEQAKNLTVKVKITSNTNIFFKLLKNSKSELEKIKTIGVTGTKGKSTTTSMIHHVLNNCGFNAFLGGNIGIPPLSLWPDIKKATLQKHDADKPIVVVLEMSSHQLSDAVSSPNIAVVLDIEPEHLDYYSSFDEYIKAKTQITRFQTNKDLVIFDDDNEIPTKLANLGKAKQVTFGLTKNIRKNANNAEKSIIYKDEEIINTDQLPVRGKHNVINSIPSIIIAKELGCKTSDIAGSLKTFRALPHRLEIVAQNNGVTYVNDSLSTAPKSAIAAINSFDNSPIILIAGGHDRSLEFTELAKAIVDSNVKHLILFPTTGEKILKEILKLEKTHRKINHSNANSMKKAVETAKSIVKSGDVVLLSPASASFGLFKNYRDRGDQFKKLVNEK
jgi:UDP-N-acetylmuramoylalanine--D-glutamate ligase